MSKLQGNLPTEIDLSHQNIAQFPKIDKSKQVTSFNISNNLIEVLPNMGSFSLLRVLDISHNRITSLKPICFLKSLRELDCSYNLINEFNFPDTNPFPNLKVLHISHNLISQISSPLPSQLIEFDISYNQLASLNFLIEFQYPPDLEVLDVHENNLNSLIELSYISVFSKLAKFNTGFSSKFSKFNLIPYIKYLCPWLIVFDNISCSDLESSSTIDGEAILQAITTKDEEKLLQLIPEMKELYWDQARFYDYQDDVPETSYQKLQNQIMEIESRLPSGESDSDITEKISQIENEVNNLQEKMMDLTKILYAHDCALRAIFNQDQNYQ